MTLILKDVKENVDTPVDEVLAEHERRRHEVEAGHAMSNLPSVHDPVNNPAHYTAGGIECIDYLEAKLTPEEFRGFLKGNVIKYLSRANLKGGTEDYKKAAWYAERLARGSNRTT